MLKAGSCGSLILLLLTGLLTGILVSPVSGAVLMFNDFNTGLDINQFGGSSDKYSGNGGSVYKKYSGGSDAFGNSGFALEIDYSVPALGSYAGYWMGFAGQNLSGYRYLSFRVRGKAGGEILKVGIKDNSSSEVKVSINNYLPSGVSTSWQKVLIPLSAFSAAGVNLSTLNNVSFTFEYPSGSGTVFIDDVLFRDTSSLIWIDNFENSGSSRNAKGGQRYTWTNAGTTMIQSVVSNPGLTYGNKGYSLKLLYNNISASTCGYWTELNSVDASYANDIVFYCLSPSGTAGFLAGLKYSGAGPEKKVAVTGLAPSVWTKVQIPLSTFGLPSNTNMYAFSFTVSSPNTNSLYIDDIYFDDTNFPKKPMALTADGNLVNNGFSFKGQVALSATADGWTQDHSIEGVRFEYSLDGSTWKSIGVDYDDTDQAYQVNWNTSDLKTVDNISLRAVSFDSAGNETASDQKIDGSVVKVAAIAYPNPYYFGAYKTVKFINVPNQAKIKIFTVSGTLITTINQNTDLSYTWSGMNANGDSVPTGIYLYYVEKDNEVYNSGKFAVINNQ
jgi:hypothetical protein